MHQDDEFLTKCTRRGWVRWFMFGTMATLSGPRWIGSVLAEVLPTGPGLGVVRLKAADIKVMIEDETGVLNPVAVLVAPGGSVQYSFNTGLPPFTLNRVGIDRFVTLDSVCTHFGCVVGRYKAHVVGTDESVIPPVPIMANLMRCPCHGSRYDIEGRVFRDGSGISTEPAARDLARFETSYDAATDIVSIAIPGLSLHISSISILQQGPAGISRVKLVLPVTAWSRYEIARQDDLSGEASRVNFSTSATGPTDQSVLFRTTDGDVEVYVDTAGPRGFFAVGILLDDVPA